ncbi:MAG: hypothetical protein H0W68_05590 [Gemmatimonadaceae bacterium]|nr:hypothetical protein [Gemmatimonadaceae bacterium]
MRTLGLLASLLVVGCNGKSNPEPGSGLEAVPNPPVVVDAHKQGPVAEPIDLPKLSGKPAAKTTTPHTKDQYEALARIEFKGFTREPHRTQPNLELKQMITARPKIDVLVNILPCKPCTPMQLDKWKADTRIKQQIPRPLRDQADLEWEMGETEVGGAKLIYTYELGQYTGPDPDNGEQRMQYSDAYVLYFNDSVNQLRVIAKYADDPLAAKQNMARVLPREDLEKIAKALFDSYAQAWGN